MNFWRIATKVFAFFILLFANFSIIAQVESSIYRLQTGTVIRIRMDNEINSAVSGVDDTFTTTISAPVIVRETVVLPIGTVVEGRILKVKRASIGGKNGRMDVLFEKLRFANGEKREIEAVLISGLKAETSQTSKILTIIGGTAIGGILGGISKSENGVLIGAGIGAGAGTTIALLRKGKDVSIKADEEFEIKLTKDVTLPVQDY